MPVYIIRAGETEFVKIGWTARADAQARCENLQTGHYEELRLIRVMPGPESLELWMHRRFADRRVRREWFRFCTEMLTVTVDLAHLSPPLARVKRADTDPFHVSQHYHFKALRSEPGRLAELAAAAGVTPNAVRAWSRINRERVLIIAEKSGLPLWRLRPDVWPPPAQAGAA